MVRENKRFFSKILMKHKILFGNLAYITATDYVEQDTGKEPSFVT